MIKPKKSLGQNFLKDKNIVNKIINSINIKGNNIIEIGPGLGALTYEIIKLKPKNLIIIEKDILLFNEIKNQIKDEKIIILNSDALKFDFTNLSNYQIISNLPYNISSKFLIKVMKFNKNIKKIVCMIQSELAEKFNYKIGKINKYKFLTQYCSDFEILFNVSSNVFYPKPKVNSKVVKFNLKNKDINSEKLELFIKLFFINKRKKIKSNKNLINIVNKKFYNYRYEDLSFEDILEIYESFNFFSS
ncbi:MAG: ribosomal RNA small subunit methyltransferase A [Pelagibacteraceae bacterium]|nr:ribosomal RNA small subunit methyltransferase A [Pelagibacteraceae bacterium]